MDTCPACRMELPRQSRFCPGCGMAVPAVAGEPTGPYQPPDVESPPALATPLPAIAQTARFTPGHVLADRYRIVSRLGKGGMGEVYRADDLRLGQSVALKFLPEGWGTDPVALAQLHEEVRLTRQISHPNVCRVYDIAETNGQTFLSMEFIDGEDLASLLRRIGRLPPDKGVEIARQICLGLAAAHDKGVIHRDLKPANIMLDGRGQVRVTDFGLARVMEKVTGDDARSGTPAYMSPEQLTGKEATARSDIYALGLVLYEVFTGKKAFKAASQAELGKLQEKSSPPSPSSHVSDLDPAIERVILRCLERDPDRRPPSVLAVAAALPGGDPLAAALAAGETPSPEMVANAGESGTLSPVRGFALLAAVLFGLVVYLLLYNRVMMVGRVGLPEATDALALRARAVLKLARQVEPFDRALGYDHDLNFLRWMEKNDTSPTRWERINQRPAAAIYFWYRQSPRHLVPSLFYPYAGSLEVSRISWDDPPPVVPGMASVKLDVSGNLLEFLRIPSEGDAAEEKPPVWADWFGRAGLELGRFEEIPAPSHVPPVFADQRHAWVGALEDQPSEKVAVQAATHNGRVVSFQVVTPWTGPDPAAGAQGAGLSGSAVSQFHLFILVLVAMFVLGPYSLRTGRADTRGAFRLGVWVFVIQMVVWLVETHHVLDRAELKLVVLGLAFALYWAALVAFSYLALEPFVRRWWPETIISWTRLLSGRVRDPLVGRDLLVGVLGGVAFTVVGQLGNQVPAWFGEAAPTPWWDWWVPNTQVRGYWLGNFLINLVYSFRTAFFFNLLFLLLLRVLLRKPWLAGLCYVLIWTVQNALDVEMLSPSWGWLFFALNNLLLLGLLIRFGALAIIAASFVINTLWFPMTLDLSASYAGSGLLALGTVVLLAGYGLYTSVGGQSLFGKGWLEAA
jgi:eukaryotic-like serine/threonine-protein kinase